MVSQNFYKQLTVLYVEDDDSSRLEILPTLEKIFTKVISVKDGLDAIEAYKKSIDEKQDIHLIISNMNLPKVNGLDLLEHIRKLDSDIPFMFTTGVTDSENLLKAIELNVNYYLLKPVKESDLVSKIELAFEKRYYKKALDRKQEELDNYIKAINNVALIFKMKTDGTITFANESFKEISKYPENEILSVNFHDLVHPDVDRKYLNQAWDDVKSDKIWKGNTKFLDKNKEVFYMNNSTFKIIGEVKDEFITIGFLTTKENLEKREFHKKVLQSIQEFNKKESQYKQVIAELQNRISQYSVALSDSSKEKEKTQQKEQQIKHLELQMKAMEEKFSTILNKKKKDEEEQLEVVKKVKDDNKRLKSEKAKKDEEIEALRNELLHANEQIERNLKRIENFETIVADLEGKLESKGSKSLKDILKLSS